MRKKHIYTDEQKIYETHRNALAELEHLFESDSKIRTPIAQNTETPSNKDPVTDDAVK